MLDKEPCDYYLPQVDLVFVCSDNIVTRYLTNHACVMHKVSFIVGAATGFIAQKFPNHWCFRSCSSDHRRDADITSNIRQ